MKTPLYFALLAILSVLCSCSTIHQEDCEPSPEPIPVQNGTYLVRELNENGQTTREWEVKTYRYTMFPRSVEFTNNTGVNVCLNKSFQIVRKP
jgi:hypothetical protein